MIIIHALKVDGFYDLYYKEDDNLYCFGYIVDPNDTKTIRELFNDFYPELEKYDVDVYIYNRTYANK